MNNETEIKKIPKRILNSLLLSVSAGVVPRIGAPYIRLLGNRGGGIFVSPHIEAEKPHGVRGP